MIMIMIIWVYDYKDYEEAWKITGNCKEWGDWCELGDNFKSRSMNCTLQRLTKNGELWKIISVPISFTTKKTALGLSLNHGFELLFRIVVSNPCFPGGLPTLLLNLKPRKFSLKVNTFQSGLKV